MKQICLIFAIFVSAMLHAAEFTLKESVNDTDFDWSDGTNYVENAAPNAGDYVIIPKGVNAKLSHEDKTSWDLVSSLGRVRPTTATSYFTVSVPDGVTATLACEITNTRQNASDSQNRGGLVKIGTGTLRLVLTNYGYYTAITVEEGNMIFEWADVNKCCLDTLTVRSGCIVNIDSTESLVLRKFFGEGEITSSKGAVLQTFSSDTLSSDFSGKLTGNLKLTSCSIVMLRGTESENTGNLYILGEANGAYENGARLGVTKLGSKDNQVSSIGGTDIIYFGQGGTASGTLLYLGNGEVSDKNLRIQATNKGSFPIIDGGANGNLKLTGELNTGTAARQNNRFGLAGSNVNECVLAAKVTEGVDTNGNHVSYHIVKRGSGTWRLAPKPSSTWAGALSIEEGTVKYDTIAAAGSNCALGYATNLFEQYTGAFDKTLRVNWAISLGSTDGKEGTIEYSGTEGVVCSTRPIALKGDGRIRQNVEKPFRFSGISSDGEAAKKLTLDGTGTAGNEISGISDDKGGAISVVKEGSGTWTLTAANSFNGSLVVKEGTLNVCVPNWNWFKFVDRQNFTNEVSGCTTSGKGFYVREMAFFNADGISQTVGTTFADSLEMLVPGTFTLANDVEYEVQHTTSYPNASWNSLFNDMNEPVKIGFEKLQPKVGNESSWAEIVVRLPVNAESISSFDYVWAIDNAKNGCNTQPSYFTVLGSLDGFQWTELFSTNYAFAVGAGKWVSDNKSYSNGNLVAARTDSNKSHKGMPLLQPDSSTPSPIDSASCVSVSAGATLKCLYGMITLDSFGVDMTSGGGTVEGFAFAETGTLHLSNVDTDSGLTQWEKTFTPVNCTGVANLSEWSFTVNGSETSKYGMSVTEDGKVRLLAHGLRVIIR